MLKPDEQGLGLVELIVAMLVSAVVLGIFASMFVQAFRQTSDNDAQAISSSKLTEALDRLGDDLRATRSPARAEIGSVATRVELRVKMNASPVTYGDVVVARGRELTIWTDSEAHPAGPRCATWRLETVMDERVVWALTRRSGANCAVAASAPAETVALLGPAAPATDAFRYGVLAPAGGLGMCSLTQRSPGAVNLTNAERLRIVSVDVDLGAIATRRGKRRTASGRSAFDVISRLNDDYYYAIGCTL